MILVSSCLLGLNTRYDGRSNDNSLIMQYAHLGKYLPVCPEQLSGLPTPRCPVEIIGGSGQDVLDGLKQVCNREGQDFTMNFIKGAEMVVQLVRHFPVTAAILKERSPSCGVHYIYDGSFARCVQRGQGVMAALLARHNIPVYSEEDLTHALLEKLFSQ